MLELEKGSILVERILINMHKLLDDIIKQALLYCALHEHVLMLMVIFYVCGCIQYVLAGLWA